MTWKTMAAMLIAVVGCGVFIRATPSPADPPNLTGRWTLNAPLSELSKDVGFGMDLVSGLTSGGGTGRESGGGFSEISFHESEQEAKRREQLVDEASDPSPHLIIAQTAAEVTIVDEQGRARTFHPDGRPETQALDQAAAESTAKWTRTGLEVTYKVEANRDLRYTYSRSENPLRLTVEIQFVERGGHTRVTRVYEPTRPGEPPVPPRRVAKLPPTAAAARPPGTVRATDAPKPGAAPTAPAPPGAPDRPAAPAAPQKPGDEFKGLTTLGLVVEDLTGQAAGCGLSQAPIETAAAKSLMGAGLRVLRNSDEDTYVYVRIVTTKASADLCVSSYDAFLYSYTTTTLPYQTTPALVQVSLLHQGGITSSAPATHGDTVMRTVTGYVNDIAAKIRDANR